MKQLIPRMSAAQAKAKRGAVVRVSLLMAAALGMTGITLVEPLPAYAQEEQVRTGSPRLTVTSPTGAAGKKVKLRASLKSKSGMPLEGREITFSARWDRKKYTEIDTAETDENGVVEIETVIPANVLANIRTSSLTIIGRASFAGDVEAFDGIRHGRRNIGFTIVVTNPKPVPVPDTVTPQTTAPTVNPSPTSDPKKNATSTKQVRESEDEDEDVVEEEDHEDNETPNAVPPRQADTPPPTTSSRPAESSSSDPMEVELRNLLKEKATNDSPLAPDFVSYQLPAGAVAVKKEDFASNPPRFWVSARLLQCQPRQMPGLPGFERTEWTLQLAYTMTDTFTGTRHVRIFQTKETTSGLTDDIHIPGTEDAQKAKNEITGKGLDPNSKGSKAERLVLTGLFKANVGDVVRKGLRKLLDSAVLTEIQRSEWMLKVIDADEGEVLLSSGPGIPVTVGERLLIKLGRILTDPNNPSVVVGVRYKDMGEVEVTEVKPDYIAAKPVRGSVSKGQIAFRQIPAIAQNGEGKK